MPNFIIIGAQKCGTTSLYNYLIQHPLVAPAAQKEVHFFNLNFERGIDWYQSQFPNIPSETNIITGEASPYYIFHPLVPQRIHDLYPQVKLIALLRNPIHRTISHYYHELRLGYETASLEVALKEEPNRLKGEVEKIVSEGNYYSFNHQHYTYLSRSIYAEQLKTWLDMFPREQLLILPSEEFFRSPAKTLNQVCDFLKIPPYELSQYTPYNIGDYPDIDPEIYKQLQTYFAPHNHRLEELLGKNFVFE
jgi:Sulfotransferase domain